MTQMLIIRKFPNSIMGRTKRSRGPRVCDPCSRVAFKLWSKSHVMSK